jgi:plasmid stabilization system protein ParE
VNLRFHPEARDDIKTIAERYADVSVYRRSNLKKLPYHILFEAGESEVRVLVVRHNRRDPSFGLDRE